MAVELGILFAIGAMLAWGFGDFFIQRTTRKLGDWETLFILDFFGMIILLPFVYKEIIPLFESPAFVILIIASLVLHAGALLNFEAMKRGKLAVVELVFAVEVPITAFLAIALIGEA